LRSGCLDSNQIPEGTVDQRTGEVHIKLLCPTEIKVVGALFLKREVSAVTSHRWDVSTVNGLEAGSKPLSCQPSTQDARAALTASRRSRCVRVPNRSRSCERQSAHGAPIGAAHFGHAIDHTRSSHGIRRPGGVEVKVVGPAGREDAELGDPVGWPRIVAVLEVPVRLPAQRQRDEVAVGLDVA
jgi:hypothetical protein